VSEAHFGGFLSRSDIEFAEGKSNTRKEWIDNMIAESKKRKADRQRDHEDTVNMTVDLDKQWKTLMTTLKSAGAIYTKKKEEDAGDDAPDTDPYNVLMRELQFEAKKGKAQVLCLRIAIFNEKFSGKWSPNFFQTVLP
jgi:nucleolar protein 14